MPTGMIWHDKEILEILYGSPWTLQEIMNFAFWNIMEEPRPRVTAHFQLTKKCARQIFCWLLLSCRRKREGFFLFFPTGFLWWGSSPIFWSCGLHRQQNSDTGNNNKPASTWPKMNKKNTGNIRHIHEVMKWKRIWVQTCLPHKKTRHFNVLSGKKKKKKKRQKARLLVDIRIE